jgi:hypothetical protein
MPYPAATLYPDDALYPVATYRPDALTPLDLYMEIEDANGTRYKLDANQAPGSRLQNFSFRSKITEGFSDASGTLPVASTSTIRIFSSATTSSSPARTARSCMRAGSPRCPVSSGTATASG